MQIGYAAKKGIGYVFIANGVELLGGNGIVRNLKTGEEERVHTNFIGKELKEILKSQV